MESHKAAEAMTYQTGECSCASCQGACQHVPGWFMPEQIETLARNLGMTVQELFNQHLQVDWYENGDDPIFLLAPRMNEHDGGSMYPGNPKGYGCHWFVNGKCTIHTLGKPAECQRANHDSRGGRPEDIARAWEPHQKMVRDLYGDEPQASSYSFLDMLYG